MSVVSQVFKFENLPVLVTTVSMHGFVVIMTQSMFSFLYTLVIIRKVNTWASALHWCNVPACLPALLKSPVTGGCHHRSSICLVVLRVKSETGENTGHLLQLFPSSFSPASSLPLGWSICRRREGHWSLDQSNYCWVQLWRDEVGRAGDWERERKKSHQRGRG